MKKKHGKRTLLVVLAALLLAAAGGFAYISPMLRMHPTPTGAVGNADAAGDTDILALNSGPNSLYFLPTADGYLLVDAGGDAAAVARDLPALGIEARAVTHILLTHTDSDHVAALALFPDARILLHHDELQMIDGSTRRNLFGRNRLPDGVDPALLLPLADGEELELGGRTVVCLAAPGHTPGSAAFLVDGRYLFTGDALRAGGGAASVHPYTMDSAAAAASIERLLAAGRGTELLLTAHYGAYDPADLYER